MNISLAKYEMKNSATTVFLWEGLAINDINHTHNEFRTRAAGSVKGECQNLLKHLTGNIYKITFLSSNQWPTLVY